MVLFQAIIRLQVLQFIHMGIEILRVLTGIKETEILLRQNMDLLESLDGMLTMK